MKLTDIETPALVLDDAILERNLARMRTRITTGLGARLRPHVKTAKSIDVVRRAVAPGEGITVSTLKEAEQFFAAGYRDILYAVGIVKPPRYFEPVKSRG